METERPVRRLTIAINETIVASVAGSSGDADKGKDIHYTIELKFPNLFASWSLSCLSNFFQHR